MTRNFKSKAGYARWLAYGHIHGVMHGEKLHYPAVKIGGHIHKVAHHMHKHLHHHHKSELQ